MPLQKTVLTRIGVFSIAKIAGVVYGAIGLVVGLVMTFFAVIGTAFGLASQGGGEAWFGLIFGFGAVIFLPIFYGVLGFIGSAIMAAIFNVVAGMIGGVELEFE